MAPQASSLPPREKVLGVSCALPAKVHTCTRTRRPTRPAWLCSRRCRARRFHLPSRIRSRGKRTTGATRGGCAGADAAATEWGCFGGSPMFTTLGPYAESCCRSAVILSSGLSFWRGAREGKQPPFHARKVGENQSGWGITSLRALGDTLLGGGNQGTAPDFEFAATVLFWRETSVRADHRRPLVLASRSRSTMNNDMANTHGDLLVCGEEHTRKQNLKCKSFFLNPFCCAPVSKG